VNTKIAVIGSKEFIDEIHSVSNQLTDIEIEPYIYLEPDQATEIVKNIKPCDVLFFSGALPYFFAKKERERLPVASLYLATDELAVSTSLLSIVYNKEIDLGKISIDLIDSSVVHHVLSEIAAEVDLLQVFDYRNMLEGQFNLGTIVRFHQLLWEQGRTEIALTSIHAVFDRLHSLGVPAMRITNPKISLIRALEKAKAQADFNKSKAAQVAIGYISTDGVLAELQQLAHDIQASVLQDQENQFVFYSTQGQIVPNRLHDFLEKYPSPIVIGFGYGRTIKEADQHAKIALRFAENENAEKCGFILTEEKELLGPFPQEQKPQRLKNDHPDFVVIAKQTKLSPANLSKIIEFGKSRSSLQFTTVELSDYLQVTRRSTERIVKKLVENGYVKIVGEEMTYQQGRPRAIYELNMPIY
jgi:hypothetical protein